MTQPQHPFTDVPETTKITDLGLNNLETEGKREHFFCIRTWTDGTFSADLIGPRGLASPNEAFQALRAAVRELANNLGVV